MTVAEMKEVADIRADPAKWWVGFARVKDLVTQKPIRSRMKPIQRRLFSYYRYCQERDIPCRTITLKGRRAGGSDGHAALMYLHAQNHRAECGMIGTDYRTSGNMLDKVKFFGEHDDFPGWTLSGKKAATKISETKINWTDYEDATQLESIPFGDRIERKLATKIEWPHGSKIQLYSAQRPESARSAGLGAFHWTEVFRAPVGGIMDGGETFNAMSKTVPKRGFNWMGLEGTAKGAMGFGYEIAKDARWPQHETWWMAWETTWPQNVAPLGAELQFVLIFAAWFEDWETQIECTPEEEALIRSTLDAHERMLIDRYECDGPLGRRLGSEVETTTWAQLKWRRSTIQNECKQGGADEFDCEYPHSPDVAFRASGYPTLDLDGLQVIETMARECQYVSHGVISADGKWTTTEREQATIIRWGETLDQYDPQPGLKYLVTCDPMSGADLVTGGGEKDRHSVLVLRDAYKDHRGSFWPVKLIARIKPPCQWESEVLAAQIYSLSLYYGGATIVVEANMGSSILKTLHELKANVHQRTEFDTTSQKMTQRLGFMMTEATKRIVIGTLQHYVRERMLDCCCPHVVSELFTLITDQKGKVHASGRNHDDCAVSLAIGLEHMQFAHAYPSPKSVRRDDINLREWQRR